MIETLADLRHRLSGLRAAKRYHGDDLGEDRESALHKHLDAIMRANNGRPIRDVTLARREGGQ